MNHNPVTVYRRWKMYHRVDARSFLQASVVLLCFGLWVAVTPIAAQNPKRLEPVRVIGMEESAVTKSSESEESNSPYVGPRVLECRTDTGVIGCVFEVMPGESTFFQDYYDDANHNGNLIPVGLAEVQRTEQLLVDELNRITDEVHFIPRAFTAPQFYRYLRQYFFYQSESGDTCVMLHLFIPLEGMSPQHNFSERIESENFLRVSLNLSTGRLMYYHIFAQTVHYVKGRSKERFGLSQKCVFSIPWRWSCGIQCSWEELPRQVQEGMLSVIRESDISRIEPFHPNVRRGLRLCELSDNYYMVSLRDGSHDGFDSQGRWAYTDAGFNIEWKEAVVSEECVPSIGKMLAYIGKDLESRGIDFSTSGLLRSVEKVKNHYVLVVECKGSLPVDGRKIAYTFNRSGHLIGMDIRIYF